jgi:benzil reductase ((S)-benzoin forming)
VKLPIAQVLAISRAGIPEKLANVEDLKCDLADRAGQREAMGATQKKLSSTAWQSATLVNNAGMVEPVGPVEGYDLETLSRNMNVNLVAAIALMQVFVEATQRLPKRSVINISSGAGRSPVFGWTGYCAAKAGMDMASQVVAFENQGRRNPVRVTSLAPGMTDTAMQGVIREQTESTFPIVTRFRTMKAEGKLQNADAVAAKILRLHLEDALPSGVATLAEL